jgi:hypothetical protein
MTAEPHEQRIKRQIAARSIMAPRAVHWLDCTAPGASLSDSDICGSSYLAAPVAVLLVLVHRVVRDSLAEHARYLRYLFEGPTVAPPPGPARSIDLCIIHDNRY